MNNNQFRRLLVVNQDSQNGNSPASKPGATPSTLGAKTSSFMPPMTPRTVKGGIGVDFARQVRERNAALQPTKKFKTATPKGVKYGAGYTDRARARAEAEDGEDSDSKGSTIKALEEQMKLGQISVETFEALRDEITGGDIGSTHLVKGLDRRLLERVRRGEDVLGGGTSEASNVEPPPDVDEELDKLGDKEVKTVQKEKAEKKGSMAPPPPVAGVKRSRDEIMAELKAQRKAATEAKAAPALDNRWRKVGEQQRSRIEIDHKGRQVLITVDEDGVVKKKVRKVATHDQNGGPAAMEMPDASKPILGADAELPVQQQHSAEAGEAEEDDDIFEGVGADYDPLGDNNEDDSEDESSEDKARPKVTKTEPRSRTEEDASKDEKSTIGTSENTSAAPRNYFKDTSSTANEPTQDRLAGVQDLLKKAAKMDSVRETEINSNADGSKEEQAARLKRRAEMLAQQDRDMDDLDMGFGESRSNDAEDDGDGKKVRLSEWKGSGAGNDNEGEGEAKDGGKKKRKPKKRKGDANNMNDIMRVIEGRKSGSGN